ncbi:hypothetical protein DSO57_1024024 [Entomophthora muscae]|uniref:Uncharacterized protein n=1 Tax=Entomophthora muscae TaxID=34485 RepID=A0ACC2TDV3_9FUNG|nr:hypothetical protein DSO57_1024024 [Entomophthora muscae]
MHFLQGLLHHLPANLIVNCLVTGCWENVLITLSLNSVNVERPLEEMKLEDTPVSHCPEFYPEEYLLLS